MPTALIQTITPDGSFSTDNGRLFAFIYDLDDGTRGVANHKSERSPFREGEEVEYALNGETKRGDQKLKLTKPGQGQSYGSQRPANGGGGARQPPGNFKPVADQQPAQFLGVQVGMSLNQAVTVTVKEFEQPGGRVIASPDFWKRVWENASSILRIAAVLEKGKLAPNGAKEEAEPVRQAAPPPAAARAPRSQPVTEREAANQTDAGADEDVPF